jgi:hypothetical protein
MKDAVYGEEEDPKEPEDMPDIDDMEDGGYNDENAEGSGDETVEEEVVEQKLPDFEDEDDIDGDSKEIEHPSDDVTYDDEQTAGYDRNNSGNTEENKNPNKKPEKSDNNDQKSSENLCLTVHFPLLRCYLFVQPRHQKGLHLPYPNFR